MHPSSFVASRRGISGELRRSALAAAVSVLVAHPGSHAAAQTTAATATAFLNSIGICTHMTQGADAPASVANCLSFAGIHNIRDDFSSDVSKFLTVHSSSGAKVCLLPQNGNVTGTLSSLEQLAAASALLAAEGPNEPNNFPVTYNGQTSGYTTTFLPVAQFQSALYAAVKADTKLTGIPVFASSEAGGSEPDNVGLQFLTIPSGAGTTVAAGTTYADYANTHNYICAHFSAPVNNNAWNAEDPTLNSSWDGLYVEYGHTWHEGFSGYGATQLASLPRVTTETGWVTQGTNSITQDQQGKLFMNLYLAAFKRGWSYTFIYMLHDSTSQGYWGLFDTSYNAKLSGTYLHNLTTILGDTGSRTPGALNYTIPSEPSTVHDLLLQKSNGNFELIVWDENITGQDNVTVNLGNPYAAVNVYDPTVGTAATRALSGVSSVTLTLSDHPQVIEVVTSAGMVFQAESLSVVAQTSGVVYRLVSDPNFNGGQGSYFDATAAGQYVTFDVPNLAAQTYSVRVGMKQWNNKGNWQLAISRMDQQATPTNVGAPVDESNPNVIFTEVTLGNWTPGTTSDKAFRFTVTGKSAGSTGYGVDFDYFKLVPL